MYRDLLNNVQVGGDKDLLKPKREKKRPIETRPKKRHDLELIARVIQIFYVLFVTAVVWFGGKWGVETFVSFCKGKPHMSWEEITQSYRNYQDANQ
jgi:hypothetical protein